MRQLPELDRLFSEAVETRVVAGLVAMAATADAPLYECALGRRVLPDGPAMTADSVFWLASMTKAITTAAAMQLVERRKLKLDSPIGDVLPELAHPRVLEGFDTAGEPKLRPALTSITLRNLLTHTSGFGYDIWNADLVRYQEKAGIPSLMSCLNAALATPLLFEPGTKWEYGIGIDWAGKAIERVTGLSLGDYLKENLFEPIGMKDTVFRLTAEHRSRLVSMHTRQADRTLQPLDFEIPQEPEFQMGGGGLYSTAPDYLAFQRIFLNEGRAGNHQVLKPATVSLMSQNQIGSLQVCPLKTTMPPFSNDTDFFPGMIKKWSLGFMLNTEPIPGGRSTNSLAWAGICNSYYWIDRQREIAGLLMTQTLPFGDPAILELLSKFEQAVYSAIA